MRLLKEWSRGIDAPADGAFRSLVASYTADPYTTVVHQDPVRRELHVEGQAWYHGELTITAKGTSHCLATLRVYSKKSGVSRLVWWLPERQGLRFAHGQFLGSVAAASGP